MCMRVVKNKFAVSRKTHETKLNKVSSHNLKVDIQKNQNGYPRKTCYPNKQGHFCKYIFSERCLCLEMHEVFWK